MVIVNKIMSSHNNLLIKTKIITINTILFNKIKNNFIKKQL